MLIIASNFVKDANHADFILNTSYHSASLLIDNNRLYGPNFKVVVDAVDILKMDLILLKRLKQLCDTQI